MMDEPEAVCSEHFGGEGRRSRHAPWLQTPGSAAGRLVPQLEATCPTQLSWSPPFAILQDGTEKARKVFVSVPTEVRQTEAEEIGVEHLLRNVKVRGAGAQAARPAARGLSVYTHAFPLAHPGRAVAWVVP